MPHPGMTTEDTMNTQTTPVTLTPDQLLTLANSLRVAASQFDEHADYLRKQKCMNGWGELADQFVAQAKESRELADQIENAEYITIGTSEKS